MPEHPADSALEDAIRRFVEANAGTRLLFRIACVRIVGLLMGTMQWLGSIHPKQTLYSSS